MSASANTIAGVGTMRAPCASYSSSWIVEPSPASVSMSTSWPCATSSRTPTGVMATRNSEVFTSRGTPTIMRPPRPTQQRDLRLGVGDRPRRRSRSIASSSVIVTICGLDLFDALGPSRLGDDTAGREQVDDLVGVTRRRLHASQRDPFSAVIPSSSRQLAPGRLDPGLAGRRRACRQGSRACRGPSPPGTDGPATLGAVDRENCHSPGMTEDVPGMVVPSGPAVDPLQTDEHALVRGCVTPRRRSLHRDGVWRPRPLPTTRRLRRMIARRCRQPHEQRMGSSGRDLNSGWAWVATKNG
jgi:hypothetical protein